MSGFFETLKAAKVSISAITTAVSAEVLREHVAFLKDQMDVLRADYEATQKELTDLKIQNKKLSDEVASYRVTNEFVDYRGASFKKNASGGYANSPYCPRCHHQMAAFEDFPYQCMPCDHFTDFGKDELDGIIASIPK